MQIKITINGKTATAVLHDNPTSRDFVAQLPMTLELEDYNGKEKICLLANKLTSENAPKGHRPSIDELTYYKPWGNLALFYKEAAYANGLIAMGKIISGMEVLETNGSISATFELMH
ncbi:cyclophilin-like fold protein [Flavobacterium sp.]|uniref:cyclophilin-like fold protein n=1 Tax=Flavobacterium sp. TaxID=239 RepID=UPI0025C58824|nr:cyclophilin-like fold protein [Flavobacterium sp.]MBA4275819.1 hypothetical protein [Flavobacterium sp.]